jgi:hypothetical protein
VVDVHDDEKGLASGIFETANHLLGGAVAVAISATAAAAVTVTTATAASPEDTAAGYRAAFIVAAVLAAVLGTLSATQLRSGERASAA